MVNKMGASPEYCRRTRISDMGFSQISSCKAQGIIPRTSKTNKGKKVVSPKYRKARPKKSIKKVQKKRKISKSR